MFDDLSDLLPDADLLEALADIDIGEGVVSAHDVDVINSVLGSSVRDLHANFSHLTPDVAAVLYEALGAEPDALGTFLSDVDEVTYVDPFGDVIPAGAEDALTTTDPTDGMYNDAQAVFSETGVDTSGGFSFLPVEDQAAALDVPTFPGEYVLVTHGTPTSVAAQGAELSAPEFAEVVRQGTDWNGEPIRLFSCNTGETADGFAQQLANELGVDVIAPNEAVWSTPDGPIVGNAVFDPSTGLDMPPEPPTGQWVPFTPQAA